MEQIKITVDGQEMTGNKGDTILTIAMENGVEIPNLCYNNELKIYGACGLCVVEAEVKAMFIEDVQNGVISAEQYEEIIGEPYPYESEV